MLWARVLARHSMLAAACSGGGAAGSGADRVVHDPVAQNDAEGDGVDREPGFGAVFAGLDSTIGSGASESPVAGGPPAPVLQRTFADTVDLWLTQSRADLEFALRSLGLTLDVFPTKRPLLVCGACQTGLTKWACHRVKVPGNGWPPYLESAERLTARAAAKILASSETEADRTADPTCFEGETVAVEIPNPLLAADRWIVIWPVLESLPERVEEEIAAACDRSRQWERVRRVVWCVSRDRIGPRDLLDWLSRYWEDKPVRVALFRTALLARNGPDRSAQSSVLRNVRRALDKFDGIEGHPWIVAGP